MAGHRGYGLTLCALLTAVQKWHPLKMEPEKDSTFNHQMWPYQHWLTVTVDRGVSVIMHHKIKGTGQLVHYWLHSKLKSMTEGAQAQKAAANSWKACDWWHLPENSLLTFSLNTLDLLLYTTHWRNEKRDFWVGTVTYALLVQVSVITSDWV